MIKIKKGLNLPVPGAPEQSIEPSRPTRRVALLGGDYPGMRPTMLVRVGDTVKRGQALFEDKKNAGLVFTAPQAGTVSSINRGAKRVLRSVVIDVEGDASVSFSGVGADGLPGLTRDQVVESLVTSGLWTALRTRPYSKEFAAGLDVLAKLTAGPVYVCQQAGKVLPTGTDPRLSVQEFSGIHPAGLPGTHIHFLDPVGPGKSVWFIGYQDVIALGHLFVHGELMVERVVALGGPGVARPRLLKTGLGADLDELTAGELHEGDQRVISGSVFSGRAAMSPNGYLGRYHTQVSVLPEDRKRTLFGYLTPGLNKHSVFPIYLSRLFGRKELRFTTTTNGSPRAMVPIGTFETVMPLDILPTQLLRSLLVGDLEMAMNLGCLELDEDDIALCTYACPGKYEYGPVLRDVLTQIENEG
jgi:Na+-transporting NADH:ubiquinone oxidoreductase subunit A